MQACYETALNEKNIPQNNIMATPIDPEFYKSSSLSSSGSATYHK